MGMGRRKAFDRFWAWFATHSGELKLLYSNGNQEELARRMNRAVDRIDSALAWEIGPPRESGRHTLTLTGEGNPELRRLADEMITVAPAMKDWEFHNARLARTPPERILLASQGSELATASWSFAPVERAETGRLDLTVYGDNLSDLPREKALQAVSLFVDAALGEDAVEEWIGRIEIAASTSEQKTYPLTELPDYLFWVTRREKNPLTHQV
jgi:hypothetical protein